jgi:hypothetical protein
MVSRHPRSSINGLSGLWAQKEDYIMKTVKNYYDEEAYELDNVNNEEDMYGEWYGFRNQSIQTDETLYTNAHSETSIWYN